jgi:hypothetical protein
LTGEATSAEKRPWWDKYAEHARSVFEPIDLEVAAGGDDIAAVVSAPLGALPDQHALPVRGLCPAPLRAGATAGGGGGGGVAGVGGATHSIAPPKTGTGFAMIWPPPQHLYYNPEPEPLGPSLRDVSVRAAAARREDAGAATRAAASAGGAASCGSRPAPTGAADLGIGGSAAAVDGAPAEAEAAAATTTTTTAPTAGMVNRVV